MLSINASNEVEKVEISWNIKNKKQLHQWVKSQLDEIIKMLNKLRAQQNMILKCIKHWIIMQIKHNKRLNQLKINRMSINTLKKINTQLWKEMLILKEKWSQADQSQEHQDIELQASIKNWTWRETFTLFENDHHKFFKFLNSSIFTDEDESTWDSWRIKMNDKLQTNVDHFNTENIHIVYVISRLKNNAVEHIFIRRRHDASYSYTLTDELFEHLKKIYDDIDKNQKCRHEYNALRQINKSFNVFYFKFMKLFSYLDYNDCTLMNDLQNKINNRLQNILLICLKNFVSLTRLRNFLQDVNNRQWVNFQLRSKRWIIKLTAVSDKCITFSSALSISIIDYVKLIIFSILKLDWARTSIICYTCKASDHLFKNCSQLNKINISTFHVFTSRLHEIVILKNKENEKMSIKNDETKN